MSQDLPETAPPKTWPEQVRSAVALGRTAILAAHAKVANSPLGVAYLRVKLELLRVEISMLRQELGIRDETEAGIAELEPQKRAQTGPE